jgi:Domain of unknown function (DUF4124)
MKLLNFVAVLAASASALFSLAAGSQELYKYTDKNGKVTYSDVKPKAGEKAVRVDVDPNANVMSSALPTRNGVGQTAAEVSARLAARSAQRDAEKSAIDVAQANLDKAKLALETGREPREDERRIVVRKGGNSVLRTEAYDERIAKLEADVKKAEENVEAVKSKGK